MNELKPLDITDNRTPEQVRADGDERWPDGRPYIKDGVCCVCGVNVEQEAEKYPVHVCLVKLEQPAECETYQRIENVLRCKKLAHWAFGTLHLHPICDECITNMLEKLPDNRTWLAPALADIRERHLKVGARVRIQAAGLMQGNLGTVYNHLPSRPAPWHVRPDTWPKSEPGIAYKADELDVLL